MLADFWADLIRWHQWTPEELLWAMVAVVGGTWVLVDMLSSVQRKRRR